MEKNYYPLRIGQIGETTYVLSDTKTNDIYFDHPYCNGWVVAEGVSRKLMEEMAGAYNANHRATPVYPTPLTEVKLPTNPDHLVKDVPHIKMDDVMRDELAREISKNSAHSFTEGMDLGRTNSAKELSDELHPPSEEQPTLDKQIKWLDELYALAKTPRKIGGELQSVRSSDGPYETMLKSIKENLLAIKRWGSHPLFDQLELEKVIMDLLTIVKEYSPQRGPDDYAYRSEIQNAEAALGMMQAFVKKREKVKWGHIGTALQGGTQVQPPPGGWLDDEGRVKKYPTYEVKVKVSKETITNELFFDIRAIMPSSNNRKISEAIVDAIDKMLKLKNL